MIGKYLDYFCVLIQTEKMSGFFGFFILIVTMILDFWLYYDKRVKKLNFIILAGWLVSFGFVFPLIAAQIEELSVIAEYETMDSFNKFYLLLYFPIYWCLGIIELIALLLLFRSKIAIKRHEMKLRIMRFRHFPKKTNFEKPYWDV